MTSQIKLAAITRRSALVLLLVCSLNTFARAGAGAGVASPGAQPAAKAVRATVSGQATLITIAGTAPMAYTVRRPEANLIVVDLPGVDASALAPSYRVSSPLVAGVTVRRANNGTGDSSAGLQIALRAPARERSRMAGNELIVELLPGAAVGQTATGAAVKAATADNSHATATAPVERATPARVEEASQIQSSTTNAPPSAQGQQYGQPGFVGEPIDMNVVNADIRDILNFITEKYGINFVVDTSVKTVPVTINVTNVPWNFALDSILKANRLAIEVTGNILRVATSAVIVDEARERAAEAAAQGRLREAQLNNAPLVTEFIRLNYARASGTLAGAAGSSGDFSGGKTEQSFSGGAGGDALGSSGDSGIMPIIGRRLSRRGGIETDGRSNTLIITDVKENIDAIRQLIQLLDQPEPQVEIETRIVIANRNFSRDLGVQLGASVINANGGLGSFGTLPSTTARNSGPNPFGTPGGLANTAQPTDALRATAASTIIGLTTGIFGTAQISALISAAEQRGQAKIVATPRVTALNNRSAQIESGSQIPVVTPQSGASGASGVFTTTFVSVPLRLSITPQVTDAGTVVLRVVMENNSVNGTLTNSLGTPGIDTQRMQTEVLVPDGGTTVVGGVLNDRESETQNRTPGLGGIPVIGNLFKRKAVSRSTDEILFFITPRIYRPDYQGRRMEAAPVTGTRSVQIPQPVPLGNPGSNTPVPPAPGQQLQQQTTPAQGDVLTTPQPEARQQDSDRGARP